MTARALMLMDTDSHVGESLTVACLAVTSYERVIAPRLSRGGI
jgi:hypothetical protein